MPFTLQKLTEGGRPGYAASVIIFCNKINTAPMIPSSHPILLGTVTKKDRNERVTSLLMHNNIFGLSLF